MVMKNAVIVYGSPRKRKSGSYHLGEHFAEGLKKGGFSIEEIMVHEKKIKPCLGCFSCWSTSPGKCVNRDDMDELLPILDQADLIVYAIPLYIYSVPGPVKTFMDRQLPLVEGYMVNKDGVTAHPRRNKDKTIKAFILSVAGFPEKTHFDAMIAMFKKNFRPNSERYLGEIVIAGANSMAYDENQKDYANLYGLVEQAGFELSQKGHVNESTLKQIDEITHFTPEKIKTYQATANLYWDSFLEKDYDQVEIVQRDDQLLTISDGGTAAFFAGMASRYNSQAFPGMKGVLQFVFDTGSYYLVIDGEKCMAYAGKHPQPTTTIKSPEDVWMKIARGELSGQTSLMEGLYTLEGDMSLLINLGKMFSN
jgi:multimeric flavodoxin WrbA